MRRYLLMLCFFPLVTLMSCTCNQNSRDKKENLGAMGATFPQPFYNVISSNYIKKTGIKIDYNGTNSGNHIRAFHDKVIDFAAASAFLSDEKIKEFDSEVVQIPSTLGAIVLSFNIPNIKELNLTGAVIADIYLSNIVCWNDPLIAELNPEVDLPNLPIIPLYRSDESDITGTLSYYLSKSNPAWEKEMGVGKSFGSKRGITVKGNLAVATTIQEVEGAIGYTGLEHASLLDLPVAAIRNRSGNFIKPNRYSIQQAAIVDFPNDMRIFLVDSDQKDAYPICGFSWMIVYKNQAYNNRSSQKCEHIKSFLYYVLSPEAQGIASKLSYSPLPPEVVCRAKKLVDSIEWK